MPDDAIIVDESNIEGFGILGRTEGMPCHDYVMSPTGGAIGAGLPVALGAATGDRCAC